MDIYYLGQLVCNGDTKSHWPVGFEQTLVTLASWSIIVTQNPGRSVCNGNICHWPVGFEWTFITSASRSVMVTQNPSQSVCNGNICYWPVGFERTFITSASRSVMITQNPSPSVCNGNIHMLASQLGMDIHHLGQSVCNGNQLTPASSSKTRRWPDSNNRPSDWRWSFIRY